MTPALRPGDLVEINREKGKVLPDRGSDEDT